MTFADYSMIRSRLEHSPARVIRIGELPDVFVPHTPPRLPEWPAPDGADEVRALIEGLAAGQRVIAAATACRLAVPLWCQWAEDRRDFLQLKSAPEQALALVDAYFRGECRAAEVKAAENRAEAAALNFAIEGFAHSAAASAQLTMRTLFLAMADAPYSCLLACTGAIDAAAEAVVGFFATDRASRHAERHRFYRRWWDWLRCRLAFADGGRADVTQS